MAGPANTGRALYRAGKPAGGAMTCGAGCSAPPAAPAAGTAPAGTGRNDDDPLRKQFDSRPMGDLEGITSKVEYMTFEGKQAVYVTVNFLRVQGTIDGKDVTIERPIEFFIPGGQTSDGQQWITSSMRLLSMVGQSGGSVAKAVASMRTRFQSPCLKAKRCPPISPPRLWTASSIRSR